jgi:Flp pilus assembly protein TadG
MLTSTPARRRDSVGMVTAEAAVVLPLLCLVGLVLAWVVSVGIAQVRLVDAARDAARAVARGDGDRTAAAAARRTAGGTATVDIRRHDGLVEVIVTQRVGSPSWLLVPMPSVTIRADSQVEDEHDPPAQ